MAGEHDASTTARTPWGPRALAVVLVAFSAWVLYSALRLPEPGGYVAVGPSFFPLVIGGGLLVLSLTFLVQTTVRPDWYLTQKAAAEAEATHWLTVALVVAALMVYVLVLEPLGYALATGVLFPVLSRLMGSKQPVRDIVVGMTLSTGIYLGFTSLLGVRLPAGPLPW